MKYIQSHIKLAGYKKILVSGPQRSGTTIAAKIISYDYGLPYFDEVAVKTWNVDRAASMIDHYDKFVLQCPGLSAWLHALAGPDVLIVFMLRHINDILASQKRIRWNWYEQEYRQYLTAFKGVEDFQVYTPIAAHKLIVWEKYQRDLIENKIELDYESLEGHPLWYSKSMRGQFGYKQTTMRYI